MIKSTVIGTAYVPVLFMVDEFDVLFNKPVHDSTFKNCPFKGHSRSKGAKARNKKLRG